MTIPEAETRVRTLLYRRYPNYDAMPPGERALLAMSVLANDIHVGEEGGNNRGEWVETILQAIGLGPGNPWCAAAISFALDVAKADHVGPATGRGRVKGWRDWAERGGYLRYRPERGWLCGRLAQDGTGHIGIVAMATKKDVVSYEGNTSSGGKGSQRDGDGLYKRTRPRIYWHWYIEL